MTHKTYSKEELYKAKTTKKYDQDCAQARFLLGGIGTGNISLCADGSLQDFEIFNKPNKGYKLPFTFFAIHAKKEGEESVTKLLEGRTPTPHNRAHGYPPDVMAGVPKFEKTSMIGEYPFVNIDFYDRSVPVKVSLEAFTPFIPHDPDNSGIPCAIFKYTVTNDNDSDVFVSICSAMSNTFGETSASKLGKNTFNKTVHDADLGFTGILMDNDMEKGNITYGNNLIGTVNRNVSVKPEWYNGGWWDGIQDAWDDFREDGKFDSGNRTGFPEDRSKKQRGAISAYETLKTGESKDFIFIISWYYPNRKNSWSEYYDIEKCCDVSVVKNKYACLFEDSFHVAKYVFMNYTKLYEKTKQFHDALFESTYPTYVLDALASNISVIRSTTCFRLENDRFFGWEGCNDQGGCCMGNCTHVWNYAQTLAFLFPSLERNMRDTEFNYETDENGKMNFRSNKFFGEYINYHPAADGQLGCIIRLYRDWKLSGDTDFLATVWQKVKASLDFAFKYWDSDNDCVLDSQQHNTYDIEFYGPNSLISSMFFAALKAGVKMAEAMNDIDALKKYENALKAGPVLMDKMLWNGEYYIQKIENVNEYKYQYGTGCLSDQLFGQLCAHVAGLGYVLPEEHVKRAMLSIFKYNFLDNFHDHNNVQRTYALNDEKGLLLCTWPYAGRPVFPFVYSDEVWTGFEYQVAAHLIFEGYVDEGLTIVKAVRDRHDGIKRNPWNEVECGNHYVRSMASWSVLIALSGFKYDMVEKTISFNPKINNERFKTFWSTGTAWGTYESYINEKGDVKTDLKVLAGSIDGVKVI